MKVKTKQYLVGFLGLLFLASLIFVQAMEVARRTAESGPRGAHAVTPASSKACVECHMKTSPGIIDHWKGSTHANKGVGCVECHQAAHEDVDAFDHYGATIATIVTPKDCGRCHKTETAEFMASHHAKAGNILASLDNFLAETVEGSRVPFNPHVKTPGMEVDMVNGMASANVGCRQCHGSKVAIEGTDGSLITVDELKPDENGIPTSLDALALIRKDENGRPVLHNSSWPNTGIGRLNLDGSRGSCSACHSRHDFSPRRARQPENCGKCHLGPDHPQKEIYEESKHGVAFRDLKEHMNLDAKHWVLGTDYTQAPTCATCHMSGHSRNGGKVTHDPGQRISWTNRPPISTLMDTDINGNVISETDPVERQKQTVSSWQDKRQSMKDVCLHCHTQNYVNAFYKQYDDFIINYNEKFARPGTKIMNALKDNELLTKTQFDEEIEWTWFYLWHHEGRRARHGASMMAPDYAHWHGMYEVAERFYQQLIPQAREIAHQAEEAGEADKAKAVLTIIDDILARPEHEWFENAKKLAGDGKSSLTPEGIVSAADDSSGDKQPDGDAAPGTASDDRAGDSKPADPADNGSKQD
ncbi:MAG: multiheme c-type cytochrome [Planctomycetaceae bacterium]